MSGRIGRRPLPEPLGPNNEGWPDINPNEFLVILVIAMVVIGPQRLPEYAQTLRKWVRQGRNYLLNAREQVRHELGPEFDDVDWTKFDPRQYDPRRIVREALAEDLDDFQATISGRARSVESAEAVEESLPPGPSSSGPVSGSATVLSAREPRQSPAARLDGVPPPFDDEAT